MGYTWIHNVLAKMIPQMLESLKQLSTQGYSVVEHTLGKGGVGSSILLGGTIFIKVN